jgi:hypothetical protein
VVLNDRGDEPVGFLEIQIHVASNKKARLTCGGRPFSFSV